MGCRKCVPYRQCADVNRQPDHVGGPRPLGHQVAEQQHQVARPVLARPQQVLWDGWEGGMDGMDGMGGEEMMYEGWCGSAGDLMQCHRQRSLAAGPLAATT